MTRPSVLVFAALLLAIGPTRPVTAETAQIAKAENGFAVDLYDQISKHQNNFIFSPYSVSAAVGMVYAGARGETAAAIARALHVNGSSMEAFLRSMARPVIDRQMPGSVHFIAADAAWLSMEFHCNPVYRAMFQDDFSVALKPMDFSDPRGASIAINRWVVANTEGQIHDIVSPTMFFWDTGLVLTNAVYFRADWSQEFEPSATRPQVFHRHPLDDVHASMMHMVASFNVTEAEAASAFTLAPSGDAPPPPIQIKPIPFIADHPFLYIIRANSSGAILFMGRLDDPVTQD